MEDESGKKELEEFDMLVEDRVEELDKMAPELAVRQAVDGDIKRLHEALVTCRIDRVIDNTVRVHEELTFLEDILTHLNDLKAKSGTRSLKDINREEEISDRITQLQATVVNHVPWILKARCGCKG
jgi:hypothetical protein